MRNRGRCRATVLAAAGLCIAPTAAAEGASATGKGIAGGALLGAEAAVITESLLGVTDPWWYLLGGTLGAAAGGTGGYFVEQNASARVSFYMLVGGMAMIIPSTIFYFEGTAYQPPPDDLTREPLPGEPLAEPPDPTLEPELSRAPRRPKLPMVGGFVGLDEGELAWSVPNVEVSNVFSREEVVELGVEQQAQVLVPVFHGRF